MITKEQAIYCMTSYLPDNNVEHCINCPYYGSVKSKDGIGSICRSNNMHEMAINALKDQIALEAAIEDLKTTIDQNCNKNWKYGVEYALRTIKYFREKNKNGM